MTSLQRMARNSKYRSGLSLAVLAVGFVCFFVFDLDRFFSFFELRKYHLQTVNLVEDEIVVAILLYLSVYILIVTFSLPVATLLTLVGGFLFGSFLGTLWVMIGATIGATVFFLFAKSASGLFDRYLHHGSLSRIRKGFERNAFGYLLLLRLVPIFPFFLVNISSVLLGVRLRTYVLATVIGIAPMSFAYASFGSGASTLLMQDSIPTISELLEPEIFITLVGIVVLVVVMIIYRAIRSPASSSGNLW